MKDNPRKLTDEEQRARLRAIRLSAASAAIPSARRLKKTG